MRIYEYNESTQTLNTECGLFHIGDTVQLTEIALSDVYKNNSIWG